MFNITWNEPGRTKPFIFSSGHHFTYILPPGSGGFGFCLDFSSFREGTLALQFINGRHVFNDAADLIPHHDNNKNTEEQPQEDAHA